MDRHSNQQVTVKLGFFLRHSLPIVLLATALASSASAQTYPNRPIRIVNPYAAGNTGDISFRTIASVLEAGLGQRFVL